MSIPTEILPGVFIGDQFVANNFEFFVKHNIVRVINCTPDVPFYFPWVQYFRINLNDISNTENNEIMAKNIPFAITFIYQVLQENFTNSFPKKSVLIHCHAGISRSCTVAAALLRSCCTDNVDIAIAMVISKRPIAFFNGTFINFRKALYLVFNE